MFILDIKLPALIIVGALTVSIIASTACEDLEVADFNPEFRPVPTIAPAPTIESAPTVQPAPTQASFEGFKQAPTVEKAGEFKQAPTVEKADAFEQAPTATEFEGFNEGNPCETYLEDPTPNNAQDAAQWAIGILETTSTEIDPNNPTQLTAACQAALNRIP